MNLFPPDVVDAARQLLQACRERGWRVATAESCTGGLVSAAITEIAGSSDVVERGFVTYSNAAKHTLLDVPRDVLDRFGAVSIPVAETMALGALRFSEADLSVSVTGVAGPGGGSPDKPIGLVCFATAVRHREVRAQIERYGDLGRAGVRLAALRTALGLLRMRADPRR